jgi:hypothetical protein
MAQSLLGSTSHRALKSRRGLRGLGAVAGVALA